MIPSEISLGFLSLELYPILLAFVIFLSIFLFWRAGRHELIESDLLFDFILVATVGALVFGRIFDFLIRADFYQWLVRRLIFFNIYGGLDFYGAFLGAIIAGTVYLRIKKINPWHIFDLWAAPLVFAQFLTSFTIFLISQISTKQISIPWQFRISSLTVPIFPPPFYYSCAYLVIFWILKRLATKKRHVGFFACFYVVFVPLVDVMLLLISNRGLPQGSQLWRLLIALGLVVFGTTSWYILMKKSPIDDLKSVIGLVLLSIFRFRRIITSAEEAGKFSKTLLSLPLYLLRLLALGVKLVYSQAILGFVDFINVFKTRK